MNRKHLFWIIPAALVGAVLLFVVLLFLFLTVVEYRPKPVEDVAFTSKNEMLIPGETYSIMSWNIGYSGLGKNEDFFMDGGKTSLPKSKANVEEYFKGIKATIGTHYSDILFIQEIDKKSKRSYKINQFEGINNLTRPGILELTKVGPACNLALFTSPSSAKLRSGFLLQRSVLRKRETSAENARTSPGSLWSPLGRCSRLEPGR